MSRLINSMRTKDSRTENLAVTHSTSLSKLVDMFFLAGASRTMSDRDIIALFEGARSEDEVLAFKCLFWARDIRHGAGERRFFRVIWSYLRDFSSDYLWFTDLQSLISEYGRWDDLWWGMDHFHEHSTVLSEISVNLSANNGLLAKWLPRKGPLFNALRNKFMTTPKEFRKLLVRLSNTVEQKMCAREWDKIKYSTVPSVAMNKYRRAFLKRDPERFNAYIHDVNSGIEKINAGAIFPHDIIKPLLTLSDPNLDKNTVVAQWNALPNMMEGSKERIIPVCDVSGSMTEPNCIPLSVSVSLGLYISERNEGIFKDAFITFSNKPEMVYLKGDIFQRVKQLHTASWGMNTNLTATFRLILDSAIRDNLSESEMPSKVLIISDMEFDTACRDCWYEKSEPTNYEKIEQMYAEAGYKRPQIVFWNVNGRRGNVPVQMNERGTALVSGFSPNILKQVLAGTLTTPEKFVLEVLNGDRYADIGRVFS